MGIEAQGFGVETIVFLLEKKRIGMSLVLALNDERKREMRKEGIQWVSVFAGIMAVVFGWLVFRNNISPSHPSMNETDPLLSQEKEDGIFQSSGIREQISPKPSPPVGKPDHQPFQLCLKDAVTGVFLEGAEVLDHRTQKVLGYTDKEGCLSLKGLDPGVLILHCPGYFLSLVPEKARKMGREGRNVLVSLFRDSNSVPIVVRTKWPKNTPPPKGRLRIRIDRFGPSGVGERSFPTARFGQGSQVSPEARNAWEQHVLLVGSALLDEGWFLGGYGGISLPPKGGRINFPHRGKFLLRARDDSGEYWSKATIKISGNDQDPLILDFTKGRTLSLFILNPRRDPVPGARVVLTFPRETTGGRYEGLSDEKGFVQLQGIAEVQGGRLEVLAPDFKVKKVELPVLSKTTKSILMDPLPSETVSFIVQEIQSHKPLAGVEILVGNPAHPTQRVFSDSRGRVSIKLIPGQIRNLTFHKKAYLTYGELLEILPGSPPPRIFEMVPEEPEAQRKLGLVALIKGTIVNRRGKPLKGASVFLAVEGDGFTRVQGALSRRVVRGAIPKSITRSTSDAQGKFLLVATNGGKARLIWGGEPYQQKNFVVKAGQVYHFRVSR
jgi:hypothetical protein